MNDNDSQKPVNMYDDYLITWTKPLMNGSPPSARGGHTCIFSENKLVLFGGHFFSSDGSFTYLNDTHVLDLETSTWRAVKCRGQIPAGRYNHGASLMGNRLFVYGGRGAKGTVFNDMYFLDLEDWTWYDVQWTSASPPGRYDHGQTAVGSKMVISGGWDGKVSYNDLWVFDTDSFTWLQPETVNKAPQARHGHTMVMLPDGSLCLQGGYSVRPKKTPIYHSDMWSLSTQSMQWSRPRLEGTAPQARFGHTCVVSEDLCFVIGGWSGTEKNHINLGDKALRAQAARDAREKVMIKVLF